MTGLETQFVFLSSEEKVKLCTGKRVRGRFGGDDRIKREIYYPTSLNQYGYYIGKSLGPADYDGKQPAWVI